MRFPRRILSFLLTITLAGTFAACDFSEQNYDYSPGNTLDIVGETEVVVPDTAEYYVRAFTIEKEYTWSVNDESVPENRVRRDGEFIDVIFGGVGTYTISVTNGEHEGELTVVAEEPGGEDGAGGSE